MKVCLLAERHSHPCEPDASNAVLFPEYEMHCSAAGNTEVCEPDVMLYRRGGSRGHGGHHGLFTLCMFFLFILGVWPSRAELAR